MFFNVGYGLVDGWRKVGRRGVGLFCVTVCDLCCVVGGVCAGGDDIEEVKYTGF